MEGDSFNTIQTEGTPAPVSTTPEASSLPRLSFIPAELEKEVATGPLGVREKCALAGLVLGALAVFSWIVILFGVFASLAGIALSVIGLKSNRSKYAKIGLALSIVGLIGSLWYVFAAYSGMINYNYFTSEFWAKSTTQ